MEHKSNENEYGCLEEDLLEDTEPELVDISLSGSCCSHNKLSLSLCDISEFPKHGMQSSKCKSQSMTILSSLGSSGNAGMPHSLSAQRRTNSTTRYNHVQSKVKQYIRNIKSETERNRKLRASKETLTRVHVEPAKSTEVDDLKQKLSDAQLHILMLQNNYQELLLKHTVAQKTIDELKIQIRDVSSRRHCAVQTVPLSKSYTSTLQLRISPDSSLEVLDREDVDTSLQDDIISKVNRWQDSLSISPRSSLEQVPQTKLVDSGYGGSVPNITEVPPLIFGSLMDSSSQKSTLTCSSSHGDLESVIAALQSLYNVPDSASTSYRSIRVPQAVDSVSALKTREFYKEHLKLSLKDKKMIFECLEDLNTFAEVVKSRSEAVHNILTHRLNPTK